MIIMVELQFESNCFPSTSFWKGYGVKTTRLKRIRKGIGVPETKSNNVVNGGHGGGGRGKRITCMFLMTYMFRYDSVL